MSIIKLLRHSNWISINKDLVGVIGCNAVYFLGYLAEKHEYYMSRNELCSEGYFYVTADDCKKDIKLSAREQETAISRLKESGFVESKLKGVPAKRHFRFTDACENAVAEAMNIANIRKTSFDKSAKLQTTKEQNCKQQNDETIYKDLILRNEINKESNKLLSTGEKNKFAFFDAECEARGFYEIAKRIKQKAATEKNLNPCDARFTKEAMQAKIAIWGEAAFWDMIGVIDAKLQNDSKYKAVSLPKMLITWFGDKEHLAVQLGINAMWQARFGFDFKKVNEWHTSDLLPIKSIAAKLTDRTAAKAKKGTADVSYEELKASALIFFSRLPEKWANTKWFSIEKINNEFSQIIAEMQTTKSAPTVAPATREEAIEQAKATLTQLGLTAKMITYIAKEAPDMQSTVWTIAQVLREKGITPNEKIMVDFKAACKVLKPSLK